MERAPFVTRPTDAMHPTTHILTGWCLAELVPSLTRRGYSVVGLFSGRADRAFVGVLRQRFPRAR